MATVTVPTGTATKSVQNLEVRDSGVIALTAQAQADVVQMVQVYKGERVFQVELFYDAFGASSSVSIGDGGAAARFITTTTTVTASVQRMNSAAAVGPGFQYTADDTIDLTVVGATALTGNIRLIVTLER